MGGDPLWMAGDFFFDARFYVAQASQSVDLTTGFDETFFDTRFYI